VSNVAMGCFLYQITSCEKNESGFQKMLKENGFTIEGGGAP